MFERSLTGEIERALRRAPAVALLGPRQVGKTTLAFALSESKPSVYLDLQSAGDRAKLTDAEAYLRQQAGKLVILDEIQRAPDLFEVLRSLIDERRRAGERAGQFLLLGSASGDLLQQSSETLAGRVAYLELGGLTVREVATPIEPIWLRGGFPESLLADGDAASLAWRRDFLRTYLERDVPQLSPRAPTEMLRRLWTMLAHQQGGLFNASEISRSLAVSSPTVMRHLDLFIDLLLVRRLEPWFANTGKRLTKSPRIYVRDSGLTHALLNIETLDDLLSHPVAGGSWEGFAIENLISELRVQSGDAGFYRTVGGAEIDLVMRVGKSLMAVEVKRSSAPKISRGFRSACEDLQPDAAYVVYNGEEQYPMGGGVEAIGLRGLIELAGP